MEWSIRDLMTAIYHRFFILSPSCDEVGLWATPHRDDALDAGLVDFGERKNTIDTLMGLSPSIIVYPYNGEKDAWVYFDGAESPNPFAGTNLYSSGNPVTVEFNKAKITNATLKSFSLKDGSGAEVDIALRLTKVNDRNGKLTDHQFAFFPRESLAYDENYTAKITYVADGKAGSKEWTFHTIGAPDGEDGATTENVDINVTDTNQTVTVKAETYYNLHILPGNDSIANSNTLGNLSYIDGATANNKDNSVASYDKDNIVRVYVYGNSGEWMLLEIANLKKSTGETFKVRIKIR